jgi:L-lactate dehydrogenase complex protein LldE
MSDWMAPQIGEAAVELLQRAGVAVVPVAFPSCCGLPAINSAYGEPAARMAKQTIEACERADVDWIVSTSVSCVGSVVHDYERVFADRPPWRARARQVAARTVDLASFLDRIGPPAFRPLAGPPVVTIHDSCQSKHALGTPATVRRLLTAAGYELREAPESGECCGFGGAFSFDHPEIARRMRQRKLNAFVATGASVVCGDNPGCLAHLQAGEPVDGAPTVRHLAELLRDALDPGQPGGLLPSCPARSVG